MTHPGCFSDDALEAGRSGVDVNPTGVPLEKLLSHPVCSACLDSGGVTGSTIGVLISEHDSLLESSASETGISTMVTPDAVVMTDEELDIVCVPK